MNHVIALPDDIFHSFEEYAQTRKQTPEEVIIAWTRAISDQADAPHTEETPQQEIRNPFVGFYGAFEADYPDLVARHDYYIGQEKRYA